MENSYGIGVQNRYGLFFDEDADPFDLIKKPAISKSEEKENKTTSKKPVPKKSSKPETNSKPEKSINQGKCCIQSPLLFDHVYPIFTAMGWLTTGYQPRVPKINTCYPRQL